MGMPACLWPGWGSTVHARRRGAVVLVDCCRLRPGTAGKWDYSEAQEPPLLHRDSDHRLQRSERDVRDHRAAAPTRTHPRTPTGYNRVPLARGANPLERPPAPASHPVGQPPSRPATQPPSQHSHPATQPGPVSGGKLQRSATGAGCGPHPTGRTRAVLAQPQRSPSAVLPDYCC